MSLSLLLGLAGPALAYDAGSVNQATTLSWGGSRYYAAVDTQGNLWMWSSNSYYQMGTGVGTEVEVPVKILDGVADVSCNSPYTHIIKEDGTFWVLGGNSDIYRYGEPTAWPVLNNVAATCTGHGVLKNDGTIWV